MAANTETVSSSHSPHLRLEPPGELPSPPVSNASKYTVDAFERVVRADFSRDERCVKVAGHGSLGILVDSVGNEDCSIAVA